MSNDSDLPSDTLAFTVLGFVSEIYHPCHCPRGKPPKAVYHLIQLSELGRSQVKKGHGKSVLEIVILTEH